MSPGWKGHGSDGHDQDKASSRYRATPGSGGGFAVFLLICPDWSARAVSFGAERGDRCNGRIVRLACEDRCCPRDGDAGCQQRDQRQEPTDRVELAGRAGLVEHLVVSATNVLPNQATAAAVPVKVEGAHQQ